MPEVFYEKEKIQDIIDYGVYAGSEPIEAIYQGSELIYLHQPYTPKEVLISLRSGSKTLKIKKGGWYWVEMTGAGGAGKYQYVYATKVYAGGSGAAFYGNFYLENDATVTMTCGVANKTGNGGNSTFVVNGVTVANCGGGKRGWPDSNEIGYGGSITTNMSVSGVIFKNITAVNGKQGEYTNNGNNMKGGASVASNGTYGKGADANTSNAGSGVAGENGLIFLRYIGQ